MKTDPDGEIDVSAFALDALKWLETHDKPYFEKCRVAILKDANANYVRTRIEFNSFNLLREIIEYQQKKALEQKVV